VGRPCTAKVGHTTVTIYRVSTIGWAALCLLKRLTLSIPKLKTCKSLDKFRHSDILARPIEISSIHQHVQAWTRGSPIFSILRAVHIVFIVIDRLVDGERLFARDRMLGRWSEGVTAHSLRASQDFLAKRCIAEREV